MSPAHTKGLLKLLDLNSYATRKLILEAAKRHRTLREIKVELPELVRVYSLFIQIAMSPLQKAQVLATAGGKYAWKAITEALCALYPTTFPIFRNTTDEERRLPTRARQGTPLEGQRDQRARRARGDRAAQR